MQNDSTETRPFCLANEKKQKNIVTQILDMPLPVTPLLVLRTTMTGL